MWLAAVSRYIKRVCHHDGVPQMKKLLLAAVFALAVSPAMADTISLSGSVDGVNFGPLTSPFGSLNIINQSVGTGIFNLNTVTVNSESFLAAPGVLATNTLNIQQADTGNHLLVLDITAFGLAGIPGLTNFLSSFSVTGQSSAGWFAREQTFINGNQLADTGIFAAVADSAFSTNSATIGSTYNAEVIYTINSRGVGQFNGGIDISVAAVPGPVVGAGLPGMLALLLGVFRYWRQKNLLGV
jgi:hypothetical protein